MCVICRERRVLSVNHLRKHYQHLPCAGNLTSLLLLSPGYIQIQLHRPFSAKTSDLCNVNRYCVNTNTETTNSVPFSLFFGHYNDCIMTETPYLFALLAFTSNSGPKGQTQNRFFLTPSSSQKACWGLAQGRKCVINAELLSSSSLCLPPHCESVGVCPFHLFLHVPSWFRPTKH